jgi:hypothetical protein
MQTALATFEAMLFAQLLRPFTDRAGPAGPYAAQTFADLLVTAIGESRG